ncbi:MAG: LacI family transcriptional regulator [Youngiibacter sp.]|nr:LacI family transcriptional regulator [Youngiibacter sp.]
MATMKDVAKLACVDISTVSRALNDTAYVHPETRARIFAAVKELSYQPNVLAQGLKKGKRHTIGVVLPRLHMAIFSEIMQGIEKEARKYNYATLICNTEDDPEIEKESLSRLRNGFVDGIIIAGTGRNVRLLHDIKASGIAIAQIVRDQDTSVSSVIANYEACGYEGTMFLARKGCKEIGLINGNTHLAPYRDRYKGYKSAIKELNLKENYNTSLEPSNTFEYGYNCAKKLLENNEKLDAIMVSVDIQGIGAMRAIKEKKLRVPEDIRLMSLTGHAVGSMLETTMTALEIPAHEMGEKVAKMIIEDIEAPSDKKPSAQHLTFNASLVEREST